MQPDVALSPEEAEECQEIMVLHWRARHPTWVRLQKIRACIHLWVTRIAGWAWIIPG